MLAKHSIKFLAVLVLWALSASLVWAQPCPVNLQIRFADGSRGCFSDLAISKLVDKTWNLPLQEVVKANRRYSVAQSTAENCQSIFIAAGNYIPSTGNKDYDKEALSGCARSGCPCATVVSDGVVLQEKSRLARADASVTGTDSSNQSREQGKAASTVLQLPAVADSSAVVSNPTRRALVIGNDNYQNVNKLQNARADARSIGAALASVGFEVTIKVDLSERSMKDVLRTFKGQIQGGDEVVLYFAGHGVQIGPANYLLPVDIRGQSEDQVKDEAIPLQRLLDDLQDARVKFSLTIIDACRDNPFRMSGRAIGGRGLLPPSTAIGQIVIFSAGAGQQALDRLGDDDKDPNGLFTRVFLKEMRVPSVPIDRVLRAVRSEVVRLSKGVGHEQVPALYDQALGDFYFRR